MSNLNALHAACPDPDMAPSGARSKHVVILTYGSRGDVQPFVALGVGLRNAGYAVRLAGPEPFGPLVRAHGLAFAPIPGDPYELTQALSDRAGLSWLRMIAEVVQHVLPLATTVFRTVERVTRHADLIVHSFLMTDAGHTLAHLRGVPDVSAQFFPIFLPTSAFPAVALPDLAPWGTYRRATHALTNAVFRYGSRLLYRRVRACAPDLPDLAPWPFAGPQAGDTPILLGYSRHVLPRPPDWPSYAHVTGYWQLPPLARWAPSDELIRFLASGPPPVYFGPGSVRTEILRDLVRTVIDAARACGQRLVLGASPQVPGEDLGGTDVLALEDVPHAWLFPRMRYVLHHGGAGTTGAATAAGVPNTAIPFSTDQAFWARQIQRCGLGPASPPARRLTRGRLEVMLRDVLSNSVYQRRATAVGDKLRQEDGVASAVRIVQAQLGLGHHPA